MCHRRLGGNKGLNGSKRYYIVSSPRGCGSLVKNLAYTVWEDTRLRREKTPMSWPWMNCPRKRKLRGVQKMGSLFLYVVERTIPKTLLAGILIDFGNTV